MAAALELAAVVGMTRAAEALDLPIARLAGAEAQALLEDGIHRAERIGMVFPMSGSLARLAELRLSRGALDEARDGTGRALDLARARGERGTEAWALRLLGAIASRPERPDLAAAETHFLEAIQLATRLEMRPLVAHCHADLAKLYRRTGKPQQAGEHVATATTMYRGMGMADWPENVETEVRGPG